VKQVVTTATGGPDVLRVQESADPTPAGDEVRIRVAAAGVNFADIMARRGLYPDAPKLPATMGYEVSGVVDAVGPDAGTDLDGAEVFALTRFGGYADTVVVPRNQVFVKPASLSHAEAAALPVNYLTAWHLLVVAGSLTADETVLIHNAGGGVGLAAIDIGTHLGARLIGTASAGKHPFLAERGLHEAIDYRSTDWLREVMRLTDGRGVELVIDPMGGRHLRKSYKALRHTGRLGMFGISSSTESRLPGPLKLLGMATGLPLFHPVPLMNTNRGVFGVNLGHLWHEVDKIRIWCDAIVAGVADGWVRPHVDATFPLAEAGAAQAYVEARKNTGKVVLET
jgi:NADPH:quinone reductase-like Zn-dependent oxidoreductase